MAMTREQVERWMSGNCPGGAGHATGAGFVAMRQSCAQCLLDAFAAGTGSPVNEGGDWLGAVRSWMQWNCHNGSSVKWGSNEVLTPHLTVAQVEEAAQKAVAADRKARRARPASPAQGEAGQEDARAKAIEEAARVVEWSDLFWHDGDPRTRIAAKIRALASPSPAPEPRTEARYAVSTSGGALDALQIQEAIVPGSVPTAAPPSEKGRTEWMAVDTCPKHGGLLHKPLACDTCWRPASAPSEKGRTCGECAHFNVDGCEAKLLVLEADRDACDDEFRPRTPGGGEEG